MPAKPPLRFYICCLVFFSTLTTCTLRAHFSMSLVEMVRDSYESDPEPCSLVYTNVIPGDTDYNYDDFTQCLLLGSYYLGYILFSLPAELVANKFGPYQIILVVRGLSAVLNTVTVCVAVVEPSWVVLFFGRFLIGSVESFMHPATESLMSNWIPPRERSKYANAFLGNNIGMFITWPLSGLFIYLLGWEASFHLVTAQVVVFFILFAIFASNGPDSNWWITDEEKQLINQSMEAASLRKKLPFRTLFKSKPFLALAVAQFGSLWALHQLLNELPKFLSEIFEFSMISIGFLGVLPFVSRFVFGYVFGYLGHFYEEYEKRSSVRSRIIFTIISHILSAILMLCIITVGCSAFSIITLLISAQAFNGALVVGTVKNAHDIAGSQYVAGVYSMANLIGSTTGFLEPVVTGFMLMSNNDLKSWHWIFMVTGIVYVLCGSIFMIFGSGKLQEWETRPNPPPASVNVE